tara:strand:+ start:378 stop:2993 length:2616 start_codon:yes stop_codon:yes gene_type:complete
MGTRNLVPRNSGEGSVGRIGRAWGTGVFDNLYFDGKLINNEFLVMDQNVRTTDSVEFNQGNFTNGLTVAGVDVATKLDTLNTSITQVSSGAAEFVFFSDVSDNIGVTEKIFYTNTPDANTHLSGVTVATAEDLRIEIEWDGPSQDYVGFASINGQAIPLENIEELGDNTRRFKGFLDNVNLEGFTGITGHANGRSTIIPLNELGGGPEAVNIMIDEISNATARPGHELGSSHLKQGDTINIFVDFDRNDVDFIKVHNHGLAEEIDFSNYNLVDIGGLFRATIPVTVSNRSGPSSVAVQAINTFGATGDLKESTDYGHTSGTRDLDQLYPIINASDPTSYNGRSDGLREGESTTFSNSILNWQDTTDTVSYSSLNSEISITNSGIFESPKTVNYVGGIFNNSDNIEIHALRTNNGATDTERVKVKIANGPAIISGSLDSLATSTTSPHIIGTQEVKAGDTINSEIVVDGKGVSINNISISVQNEGVSKGTQTSFSSTYSKTTLSDGTYKFTVPISVFGSIGSSNRDGDQAASFKARNNFGTQSDKFTTTDTAKLNNGSAPSVSISSITYPASQQAIKDTESATVLNTLNNYDSVIYASPNNQLTISNPNTFESNKSVDYLNGGYNVKNDGGQNNIKISATKTSNGITIEDQDVVNIANTPLSLSINNLASKLISSPAGNSDQFSMSSNQLMLTAPSLSTSSAQTNPSQLTINSSGTGRNSNSFTIVAKDVDTKGTFSWQVSAFNLANIETTSISTRPTYKLEGFSSRTISASPNSLGAGLADIGTTVSNPTNVSLENISEGGTAPNGGTIYTYKSYADGFQLSNAIDENNNFTVCDSNGIADSNGSFLFNLDKLNRSANTSTLNPASFVISE